MEGRTMLCWARWHGPEWVRLVENGWETLYRVRVEGVMMARMGRMDY